MKIVLHSVISIILTQNILLQPKQGRLEQTGSIL